MSANSPKHKKDGGQTYRIAGKNKFKCHKCGEILDGATVKEWAK